MAPTRPAVGKHAKSQSDNNSSNGPDPTVGLKSAASSGGPPSPGLGDANSDNKDTVSLPLFGLPAASNNWFGRDTTKPVSFAQPPAKPATPTPQGKPSLFSFKTDASKLIHPTTKHLGTYKSFTLGPKPSGPPVSFGLTSNEGERPVTPAFSFNKVQYEELDDEESETASLEQTDVQTQIQPSGDTTNGAPSTSGTVRSLPGLSHPTQPVVVEEDESDRFAEKSASNLETIAEGSDENSHSGGRDEYEHDSLYDDNSDDEAMEAIMHNTIDEHSSFKPWSDSEDDQEEQDGQQVPASPRKFAPMRRRIAGRGLTVPLATPFTFASQTSTGAQQTSAKAPDSSDEAQFEETKNDVTNASVANVEMPPKATKLSLQFASIMAKSGTPDTSSAISATPSTITPAEESQPVGQKKVDHAMQKNLAAREADLDKRAKALKAREEFLSKNDSSVAEEMKRMKEREQGLKKQITDLQAMVTQVVKNQNAKKQSSDDAEKQLRTREEAISKQTSALDEKSKLLKEQEQVLAKEAESLAREAAMLASKALEQADDKVTKQMIADTSKDVDTAQLQDALRAEYTHINLDALLEGALILRAPTQAPGDDTTLRTDIARQIAYFLSQSLGFSGPNAEALAMKLTDLLLFRAQVSAFNSSKSYGPEGAVQLILTTFSNEILGNGLFANRTRWTDINLVAQYHDQMLHASDLGMLRELEARADRAETYFNSLRKGKVPLSIDEFMGYVKQCGEYAKALQELRWFIGEGSPAKKALMSFLMSVCKDLGAMIQRAAVRVGLA